MATSKKTEKPAPAPEAPKGAKGSIQLWTFDPADLKIMGYDVEPQTDEDRFLVDDDAARTKRDEELLDSIASNGVRKPITIKFHNDQPFVVDGRRRVIHARLANEQRKGGKKPLPPILVKAEVDTGAVDSNTLLESFAHNSLHKAHGFMAQARKIRALLDSGMSGVAIFKATGITRPTQANRLELLKLAPAIQEAVEQEKLTPSAALRIAAIEDHEKQWELFLQIMEEAGDKSYGQATKAKEAVAAAQAEGGEGEGGGGSAGGEDKPKPIPLTVFRKMLAHADIKTLPPAQVALLRAAAGECYPAAVADQCPEFVALLRLVLNGGKRTPPRPGEETPAASEPADTDAPTVATI